MLNQSVASIECRSSFALNMRCATYPPPPGSAPGYQVAHQLSEMYTRNVIIGIHAEFRSGIRLRASPRPLDTSFSFMASMPPTARTANTASTITIPILITNCTMSVTSTPHSPDSVEIADVSAISPSTMSSASNLPIPKISPRIFTIARLTQPRMIQFMMMPRYSDRKPRRNAAGFPEYRISANSMSVITPARRHSRA